MGVRYWEKTESQKTGSVKNGVKKRGQSFIFNLKSFCGAYRL